MAAGLKRRPGRPRWPRCLCRPSQPRAAALQDRTGPPGPGEGRSCGWGERWDPRAELSGRASAPAGRPELGPSPRLRSVPGLRKPLPQRCGPAEAPRGGTAGRASALPARPRPCTAGWTLSPALTCPGVGAVSPGVGAVFPRGRVGAVAAPRRLPWAPLRVSVAVPALTAAAD